MRDLPDILREYRVKILPAEEGDEAAPVGRRTKFGGVPDNIQDPEDVTCPGCFQKMHFVGQIDSFELKDDDNPNSQDHDEAQFMFGDVGMIYVWFCFDCLTPHATMESH